MTIAVDLMKHDAVTGEDTTVGRCRLDGSVVVCEGPDALLESLHGGVLSYATHRILKPTDGTDFLDALLETYRDPHFYAVAAV